ncbi:unnamed protein product [Effrenium voratum]|nr:unnamed protein product [Effrenium voratum]
MPQVRRGGKARTFTAAILHTGRQHFDVRLPLKFSLGATVCSYGFAMLAPNSWKPYRSGKCGRLGHRDTSGSAHRKGELHRPLHVGGRAMQVVLRQPSARVLQVRLCGARLSSAAVSELHRQVVRMLRLRPSDEITAQTFAQGNPDLAKRSAGVGRLFRSPSVFEDIVKTFTLCNCGWTRTIAMNEKLCLHFGEHGAFPTPADLAAVTPTRLKKACGVGYRAERIIKLARCMRDGGLEQLSNPELTVEDARQSCAGIFGLGPFGVANALQLLGHYEDIPADSETTRHLQQARGKRCTNQNVSSVAQKVYGDFAPFQFLRYWTELWMTYEDRMEAPAWAADSASYRLLTAVHMEVSRQKYIRAKI